jgi:class 3 adenylate cyclase
MPIFMDRHYIEGLTAHAIKNAHDKDLAIQGKYGCNFITYWFDEARCTGFCLVEGPNKEAVRKTHAEAHGAVPHEIIEVDPSVVEAFLGRIRDPLPVNQEGGSAIQAEIDSAFRVIMFTDLKDSTATTTRLGDAKAMHLLRIHNALTRNALREYNGREVKHLGDGIMATFPIVLNALECAIAIQQAFTEHNQQNPNEKLQLRIGLSAGEPVEEDGDLFGSAVQLAARICAHAGPEQILVAQNVRDECQAQGHLFVDLGEVLPKGFINPVRVHEVRWQ